MTEIELAHSLIKTLERGNERLLERIIALEDAVTERLVRHGRVARRVNTGVAERLEQLEATMKDIHSAVTKGILAGELFGQLLEAYKSQQAPEVPE